MSTVTDIVTRLGILALALVVCVLKFMYTLGLEMHATGGEALYILIIHDATVVMATWTVVLGLVVLTSGQGALNQMGSVRWLHSAYFTAMAAVAVFFLLNDFPAISRVAGGQSYFLEGQLALEVVVVVLMGQQLWSAVTTAAHNVADAASHF
jgi:hypothetical protein